MKGKGGPVPKYRAWQTYRRSAGTFCVFFTALLKTGGQLHPPASWFELKPRRHSDTRNEFGSKLQATRCNVSWFIYF